MNEVEQVDRRVNKDSEIGFSSAASIIVPIFFCFSYSMLSNPRIMKYKAGGDNSGVAMFFTIWSCACVGLLSYFGYV